MSLTLPNHNDDHDLVASSVDFKGRPSLRSKSGYWRSASFLIAVETAERMAYYGISSNMVSYLTAALGQSTAAAAATLNAWSGTASLTPILGAFLADSYLGRYKMIIVSSLLYILGLGCLTLSAALNPSYCTSVVNNLSSCSPPLLQKIFFFFSLYLVALAEGGHSPCAQAFGADQFDVEDEKELQEHSSYFNWGFWFPCLGILLVLSVVNYIQEYVSWELGFGIPAMVMCFALVAFLAGTTTYRFIGDGNCQPPLAADQSSEQIRPQECNLRFLGVPLLAPEDGSMEEKKVQSIVGEKGKAILKLVPIWCTSLGFFVVYAQPLTLFTKQGAMLDRHISTTIQIPAASLQLWIIISMMVFIPIYDRILVPVFKAVTKKSTGIPVLHRIGIGLDLSLISIMIAAIVDRKRLAIAREHGLVNKPQAVIPMSVWWLAPQYMLSGIANVFSLIGLKEFFYNQVPAELKSFGIAMDLSIVGIGSLLSSFLVYVVDRATRGNGEEGWFSDNLNRAHLDYFYWVLAGISAFSFIFYIYFAKSYVYNNIRTIVGH